MSWLREAGLFGASAAVAAGVAYLLWTYASSPGEKNEPERRSEEPSGPDAAVAADAPKTSASGPGELEGTQVLVLGLDGAGKTSLLHCFTTGSLNQDMQPTQGFNAVSINRDDVHIQFQEIGGNKSLRPYWDRYLSKARLLVFVVDSSEPRLFPEAKKHLHDLLSPRPDLPLMLLANKQDLPGSHSITDVHDALCLSAIGERPLFLVGTHVWKGDAELSSGVQDAWELIVQICSDSDR